MPRSSRAIASACAAYAIWGVYPLYFHRLQHVPALQVLAHRVVWSLPLVLGVLAWRDGRHLVASLRRMPPALAHLGAAAALLVGHWGVNVWALTHGHVVDASLGYFINPLLSVGLAAAVLGEPLRKRQAVAIMLAAAGVVWMGFALGAAPWIALALAASFAGYGLLRKTAPLGVADGLFLEMALAFPLAAAYLATHGGTFAASSWSQRGLLAAAGPLTVAPLLLFALSARGIPLATLGMLQYITPTLLLLLGVALYQERFDARHGIGFALVWLGIALYLGERRAEKPVAP